MDTSQKARSDPPYYPRGGNYADFLAWHLFYWGTREDGNTASNGIPWTKSDFVLEAFGANGANSARVNIRNWLAEADPPNSAPDETRHGRIKAALFGANPKFKVWQQDLDHARERSTLGRNRKTRKLPDAPPVPLPIKNASAQVFGNSFSNSAPFEHGLGLEHLFVDEKATLFTIAAASTPLDENQLRGLLGLDGVNSAESLITKGLVQLNGPLLTLTSPSTTMLDALCQSLADDFQGRISDTLAKAPLLDTREPEAALQLRLENVVHRLIAILMARGLSGSEIATRAEAMLKTARQDQHRDTFLAGNVINLLACDRRRLSEMNLSGLHVKHAFLRNAELRKTNLSDSYLEQCVLADIFGSIWQVGFRDDDKEVLASSASGIVRAWSVETGANIETYGARNDAHFGWSFGFAVSADEQELASAGGDGEIRIWRHDGKLVSCLPSNREDQPGHKSRVRAVAFRPDGTLITCSEDRQVFHWNRGFGDKAKPELLYCHDDRTTTLALSASGRFLMTGANGGEVVLFDFDNAACYRSAPHLKEVRSVRISTDGTHAISAGDDGKICIWHVDSHSVVREIGLHPSQPVKASCFIGESNEMFASGTDDGWISIWKPPYHQPHYKWQAHASLIRSLASSRDGALLASGGDDQTVMVWRFNEEHSDSALVRSFSGYSAEARAAAFANLLVATAHDDGIVRIWDSETGAEAPPFTIEGHKGRIWSLAFCQNDQVLVTGAEDGNVRAWRMGNRLPFWTGSEHEYRVFAVATREGPTPLVASGGSDAKIKIWSTTQPDSLFTLGHEEGHTRRVRDLAFSPDGGLLCSVGEDNQILVWQETENGWRCVERKSEASPVTSVRFSPDGKQIFWGTDAGQVAVWDRSADNIRHVRLSDKPVLSVAVTPKGDKLVAGMVDGKIAAISTQTLAILSLEQAHHDWVEQVAVSPDGQTIASVSDDQTVRLWHLDSFSEKFPPMKASPPYDGLQIDGLAGITEIERGRLRALGAFECSGEGDE